MRQRFTVRERILMAALFLSVTTAGLTGQSNTSTGGAFQPLIDYVMAGVWTFKGASPIKFEGATNDSVITTLTIADPTSARTWTLPDATDTVVGKATTDTLTNKTLTAPTMTAPVINTLKSIFSTATVSGGYSTDTYLAGSGIAMPAGGFLAGHRYVAKFDMVKTGAGTAQFTVNLRIGTGGGVVGDTSIIQWQFAVGTGVADTGTFTVTAYFRTVGSGTAAVVVGTIECSHALAATGLITTGASGYGSITTVSSGFDSTIAATTIGLSVNGGASFSGTNTIVSAVLQAI